MLKQALGVLAFTTAATAYTFAMGQAALGNSAAQINDTSDQLAQQWLTITSEFEIARSSTAPGALTPVVPERFSALDVSVYGTAVVESPYQPLFASANIAPLFDTVFIRPEGELLNYYAGGARIAALQDVDQQAIAVLYIDIPESLWEAVINEREGSEVTFKDLGETEIGHLSAVMIPYSTLEL